MQEHTGEKIDMQAFRE